MAYILPKKYLSSTQILKYLSCPYQYFLDYIQGDKPEFKRTAAISTGSAVHKLVENKLTSILERRELTEGELFASTPLDSFFIDSDLEGEEVGYWNTFSQILYKTWYKDVGMSIMPLESESRFDSLVGDVPVMGFIDYIDVSSGNPEIVDLKVTKRAKSVLDAKNSVQLAMYAITQENPCVRFDSLVKTKTPKVGVARHTFTQGELNYFTDLIGEVATNISAGNFPKTAPTQWVCTEKWCAHYSNCRGKDNR